MANNDSPTICCDLCGRERDSANLDMRESGPRCSDWDDCKATIARNYVPRDVDGQLIRPTFLIVTTLGGYDLEPRVAMELVEYESVLRAVSSTMEWAKKTYATPPKRSEYALDSIEIYEVKGAQYMVDLSSLKASWETERRKAAVKQAAQEAESEHRQYLRLKKKFEGGSSG